MTNKSHGSRIQRALRELIHEGENANDDRFLARNKRIDAQIESAKRRKDYLNALGRGLDGPELQTLLDAKNAADAAYFEAVASEREYDKAHESTDLP